MPEYRDLDLLGVVGALVDIGYDSWVVVEQDIFPTADSLATADSDQRHNLRELAAAIDDVERTHNGSYQVADQ